MKEYEVTLTIRYRLDSADLHGAVSEYAENALAEALITLPEVLSVAQDAPREVTR